MNARNDLEKLSDQSLDARLVLAAAQLRFVARVDFLVARWLERCAANAEAAQQLLKTVQRPPASSGSHAKSSEIKAKSPFRLKT